MSGINLTTYAADVPLPPKDHPIFSGDLSTATAEFPSLEMSVPEIILELFAVKALVIELQKELRACLEKSQ